MENIQNTTGVSAGRWMAIASFLIATVICGSPIGSVIYFAIASLSFLAYGTNPFIMMISMFLVMWGIVHLVVFVAIPAWWKKKTGNPVA